MTTHDFLTQLFAHMGIDDAEVTEEEQEDSLVYNILLPEGESGIIIGRRGETLDALQRVVRLVFQKDAQKPLVLNINGFREQREEYLVALARRIASQVEQTSRPYHLQLPPHERRIVHMALADYETISTHSEGEGDERVLLIEPKTAA